ncbi:MAG TPA: DNA polymerase III subunit chi [Rubrivivax sp.]|nr:DNA polymerase III subunit chi [Rubrivivax sp.]
MTEVEFHTGVADRAAFACRMLRKAYRQGARVLVAAPDAVLADVDRLLWTFDERDFVPHVKVPGAALAVAQRTPIWLTADPRHVASPGAPAVVLNLGTQLPIALEGLSRLIEVVSDDPVEADRGRTRWRAYKAAGLRIKHHGSQSSSRD